MPKQWLLCWIAQLPVFHRREFAKLELSQCDFWTHILCRSAHGIYSDLSRFIRRADHLGAGLAKRSVKRQDNQAALVQAETRFTKLLMLLSAEVFYSEGHCHEKD